jgi:hypothetical protein
MGAAVLRFMSRVYLSVRSIYTAVKRLNGTKVSVLETRILASQQVHCFRHL